MEKEDIEIFEIINNITKNTKIIQTMYNDCIEVSKDLFKKVERAFVIRLVKEIDKALQDYILTKSVDFHKDIQGYYYSVVDIYTDWPEFEEYVKFINHPYSEHGINLCKFIRGSLEKYKFPMENVFDCYDNGRFRYKLMEFKPKEVVQVLETYMKIMYESR